MLKVLNILKKMKQKYQIMVAKILKLSWLKIHMQRYERKKKTNNEINKKIYNVQIIILYKYYRLMTHQLTMNRTHCLRRKKRSL